MVSEYVLFAFVCCCCCYCCVFVQNCHGAELNATDALCKNNLDTCLKNVSVLLDHNGMTGIPKSKSDVDVVCKGFKMGMKCLDDFSNLCLSSDEKNMVSDNVVGAKYTFRFLCDDVVFQKDYLRYTDCYRIINSDWDACAAKFMSLVREEMTSNRSEETKVLDLCCAKHGFLNCVYTTSKIKCGVEEAIFIQKIADTLSEDKLVSSVCRHIKMGHCNAAARQTAHGNGGLATILNVLVVLWCTI